MHFSASARLLPTLALFAFLVPGSRLLEASERKLAEIGASSDGFVRFAAVCGSSGNPEGRKRVTARVKSWAPEFTIALGDGGEAGFQEVVRGSVHLFTVDDDARAPSQRLRKALAASPATWKIVCIRNGDHASARGDFDRALRMPFREWGADAVLSGNGRGYERILANGLPFFVSGPGREPGHPIMDPQPGSQCVFSEDEGAMLIEADGERIDFRFVTSEGLVVDAHTLRKQPVPGESAAMPASAGVPGRR